MARISRSKKLRNSKPGRNYRSYRSELKKVFHGSCAYCMMPVHSHVIDHYIPQAHDRSQGNVPLNLVLSCHECNGPGKKGDYHPCYLGRTTQKNVTHGFYIHEGTKEDCSKLFKLNNDGSLLLLSDRAKWLECVFDLNSNAYIEERKSFIDFKSWLLNEYSNYSRSQKTNLNLVDVANNIRNFLKKHKLMEEFLLK